MNGDFSQHTGLDELLTVIRFMFKNDPRVKLRKQWRDAKKDDDDGKELNLV
jgi:hypothetical protein